MRTKLINNRMIVKNESVLRPMRRQEKDNDPILVK